MIQLNTYVVLLDTLYNSRGEAFTPLDLLEVKEADKVSNTYVLVNTKKQTEIIGVQRSMFYKVK